MVWLYAVLPIVFDERKITWWELVIPGIFTLIGATIGALLAGLITLKLLKKQIDFQADSRLSKELEDYLKVSMLFINYSSRLIKYGEEFYDFFLDNYKKKGFLSEYDIIDLEITQEISSDLYNSIEQLDLYIVPIEFYKDYVLTLMGLQSILNKFEGIMLNKEFIESGETESIISLQVYIDLIRVIESVKLDLEEIKKSDSMSTKRLIEIAFVNNEND